MIARWRKQPNETGLSRVCQSQRGFELREGTEVVIHLSPLGHSGEWYWHGLGRNTYASGVTFPTIEDGKKDANEYYKKTLAQRAAADDRPRIKVGDTVPCCGFVEGRYFVFGVTNQMPCPYCGKIWHLGDVSPGM